MPGAIPVVEDTPGMPPSMFGFSGTADAVGATGTASAGFGPNVSGEHDTHLWMAGVMLVALALIVFFHLSGFRFATDVGITRG